MFRLRPKNLPRWRSAVLALFVIALQGVLGGTVAASCGDWLVHDAQPAADSSDEPLSAEVDEPPQAPSPCSQGRCRRSPDSPLPGGPQRSITPQPDQWGSLADFDLRLKSASGRDDLEVPLNFPDALRQPLERPPRV